MVRRRGFFLAGWLLLIALVGAGFATFGSHLDSEFTVPDTQSQAGIDALERSLPTATGVQGQLVSSPPRVRPSPTRPTAP
ncbi:hypothetical protein KZZ52_15665 [Dactylosporangium sp. AC04546]|uniref:hypothetical protein n=1 Tax=Dactylosporangium sp. AC04546 TaxID=2862460 RepID=UPI001EDEF54C|nr:hypothetical protein [Dactylosporangium sp. AC04546]WVK86744.1 hypothetical protein KZZ52_15665 [Dactylosporangium sp. AC04546]